MLNPTFRRSASEERAQLLFLGLGLAVVAVATGMVFGAWVFSTVLALLAVVALVGWGAYRLFGHDVYLVFALLSMAIGRVLSPIVVFVMYVAAIGVVGTILRAFGMNRLRRDSDACRQQTTMFVDSTRPSAESFRRQS